MDSCLIDIYLCQHKQQKLSQDFHLLSTENRMTNIFATCHLSYVRENQEWTDISSKRMRNLIFRVCVKNHKADDRRNVCVLYIQNDFCIVTSHVYNAYCILYIVFYRSACKSRNIQFYRMCVPFLLTTVHRWLQISVYAFMTIHYVKYSVFCLCMHMCAFVRLTQKALKV